MSEGASRRAVAEIRFGEDRSGITKVGGRSIHQYWSLLSPHFRDVLLAPQRRSDDGGVAWTWREALEKKPLTAAELAGVRKRLERANESFAENPVNPLMADDRSGTSSQALVDQVAAKVKAMAESMAAKSDVALADFVCRTEQGAMVHSWGVTSAAQIYYPDAMESGVSGVVLVGGKPAQGHEVVIENAKGLSVARTQSDETGEFLFSKIAPGRYRVRVTSGRVKFSVKGATVNVERGTMARLELASTTNPDEPDEGATKATEEASTETSPGAMGSVSNRKRGGFGKTLAVLLVVLLLLGGGVWTWRTWFASTKTDQRVTTQASSMTPEAFAADETKPGVNHTAELAAGDNARLSVSADGVGGAKPKMANPITSGERQPANLSGDGRRASTIGSKVDVLSGVAGSAVVAGGNTGKIAEHASSLLGYDSAQDSTVTPESMVQGASSEMKPTNSRENALRITVTNPSASGALAQAGSPAAGASGIGTSGNIPMPGGQPAGVINAASGGKGPPAQTAVAGVAPAAKGAASPETATGLGPGSPAADAAQSDVVVAKSSSGESHNNGPKVMTSETQKYQATKNTKPDASSNESLSADPQAEAENKAAHSARTPGDKRTGKKTKAVSAALPTAVSSSCDASADSASGNAADKASSPTSKPTDAQTGAKTDASLVSGDGAKAEDSAATDSGRSSPALSKASARQSAQPSSKGASKTKSAATAETKPNIGDKTKSVEIKPEAAAKTSPEVAAGPVGLATSDPTKVTLKVPPIEWKPRLVRDVIVPTLPVRVGESDAADLSRELLLKEKRDNMPETFRAPVIHYGITLQVDPAIGGRALHWEDESAARLGQESVQGNRAELVWSAGAHTEGAMISKDTEGTQVARVLFNSEGGIVVEIVGETRALFWVGVSRSPKDDGLKAGQKSSRFGWQVLRGASSHLSWRDDDVWAGGRGCRLEIALNNQPSGNTVVALVDRVSGWSLTGEL